MVFRENEMENTFRVSLASDFRVDISSSIHGEAETWFLTPIATMLQDCNSEVMKLPEGAKAKRALETERMERNHVVRLQCIQDGNSLVVTNDCSAHIDAKLVAVLGRIMVQRVAAPQQEATKRWTIFLPDENPLKSSNLRGESGVLQLFQSITGTENVEGAEEVVEMVDRNSLPLGMVPRPLMHTFNLLHRGIGLVVAKDASVDCHTPDFPDLYVHRRTDDKRVFPSMYDMFVGGVSSANEDPRTTAAREVSEELGLSRALSEPTAISRALFDCIICTSYNRCIVTVYSFQFDSSCDMISWQPEEVAWGSFVPYSVIESSAKQCIHRMLSAGSWPGEYPFALTLQNQDSKSFADFESEVDWDSADFVPDGLLVWSEAWLRWGNRSQES
jgi:8-oxo-dGTP pyrophosphatase MutT (NUDIX family)